MLVLMLLVVLVRTSRHAKSTSTLSERSMQRAIRAPVGSSSTQRTCEERDYKGLHTFPSNITRDDPPITRDYTPFLLILQGMTLPLQGIARLSF